MEKEPSFFKILMDRHKLKPTGIEKLIKQQQTAGTAKKALGIYKQQQQLMLMLLLLLLLLNM